MKTPVKYGIIAGTLAGAWLIGEHFIELKNPGIASFASYLGFIIFFSFLFLSIKQVRDKEQNGIIDFKTAMRIGVVTSVCYALVLGLLTFVNYKFVNPDYFIQQKINATALEIENSKSIVRIIQGVILIIPFNILLGTFFSAFIAAIMKKNGNS